MSFNPPIEDEPCEFCGSAIPVADHWNGEFKGPRRHTVTYCCPEQETVQRLQVKDDILTTDKIKQAAEQLRRAGWTVKRSSDE